jgi:hypothetical protein
MVAGATLSNAIRAELWGLPRRLRGPCISAGWQRKHAGIGQI